MRRAQMAQLPAPPPWVAQPLWAGETCVIAASGPSLAPDDLKRIKARHRLLVIKEASRFAPRADLCYAADLPGWRRVNGAPDFTGLRISIDVDAARTFPGVQWMQRDLGLPGLSADPTRLHCGRPGTPHAGFQAINLAVLLGAKRILLLGYDLKPAADGRLHFFPNSERREQQTLPFPKYLRAYDQLPPILAGLGVEVINCTPDSALQVFPQATLADALAEAQP